MLTVQIIKFDPTESSDKILFVNMLQIMNLMYSRNFWIIKYVGLESIFFAINLITYMFGHPFKVFSTFDSLFLSIVLLTRINKFVYF